MTKLELILDDAIRTELKELVHTSLGDYVKSMETPIKPREEVARLFGVSPRTIDAWVEEGLPRIKIRGRVMFDYQEVITFLRTKRA